MSMVGERMADSGDLANDSGGTAVSTHLELML